MSSPTVSGTALVENKPKELFLLELAERKRKNDLAKLAYSRQLMSQGYMKNYLEALTQLAELVFGLTKSDIQEFAPEKLVQLDESVEELFQAKITEAKRRVRLRNSIVASSITVTALTGVATAVYINTVPGILISIGFVYIGAILESYFFKGMWSYVGKQYKDTYDTYQRSKKYLKENNLFSFPALKAAIEPGTPEVQK